MHHDTRQKIQTALTEFLSESNQWDMSLAGTAAIYRLEQRFAALVEQPHALTVANATMGLWAIFAALDMTAAEVLTTPYTWGGSLTGLIITGNRPRFVDIKKDTLTIDPEKIIECITSRTRAILIVDIYGYPCNGQVLRKIADEHGLLLIQDCAQSFGAYREEYHTGWWADVAVFSLSWGKTLFAGEGGVIITRNEDIYDRLVWKTQHPFRQLRDLSDMPINEMAANLRMHPLAAIWAEAIFDNALDEVKTHREECLNVLNLLEKERMIASGMPEPLRVRPAFHTLTFEPRCEKSKIEQLLKTHGLMYDISSPPIVEPLYSQPAYQKYAISRKWPKYNPCPVAERQSKSRLRIKRRDAIEPRKC